jgi:imidazole glycerol-phosphate synthase subunit HisH
VSDRPVVAVLDYGIGNLRSAEKALQHCGADASLTSDAAFVAGADAVVLPGVGAFGACMDALRRAGLEKVARDAAGSGRPFLGICVGMQMLFDGSEEDPHAVGLGIIPGMVRWLPTELPRPQMQWNRLLFTEQHRHDPVFARLGAEPWAYFVHSLHGVPDDPATVAATVDYGITVNAAFRHGNVFATQFHPEKSGADGLALLRGFVSSVATVAASA